MLFVNIILFSESAKILYKSKSRVDIKQKNKHVLKLRPKVNIFITRHSLNSQ
jgi:hypothetical protein